MTGLGRMTDKLLVAASRLVLLVLVLLNLEADGGLNTNNRLNEFILHHEHLTYNTHTVVQSHERLKRSLPEDDEVLEIEFEAFGRSFLLHLQRDHSIHHKHYVAEGPDGVSLSHLDHAHYEGWLVGEPGSHVYGSVRDGVFDGTVHTEDHGTFYIERSQRYNLPFNSSIHSVIYHDRHVSPPAAAGCAVDTAVKDWMESVQNSAEPDTREPSPTPPSSEPISENSLSSNNQAKPSPHLKRPADPSPEYKWTERANRVKRRALQKPPNNKKSCSLFIQTDPLIWNHIWKQERARLTNKPVEEVDAKTQEEILSLIAQHVKAVNKIYGDTEFDAGRYSHTGHTFEVQRIKIYNSSECTGTPRNETNPFCLPNIDVSNFLNLHSQEDHQHFCLAYVFTYRDFTGGTLGLAWVASASGASGGICEKFKTYAENLNGIHQKAKRSLNTGIITFVNYNSRVPPKVSQLTLAHEIGHNFGSPHDYPEHCRPGGTKGNYIMFASATSGDRDNNNKFSSCSIQNISAVLDAVVDNRKTNCFQESDGAFCGNKIVEAGEECDCGFNEVECTEQCCHPRMNSSLSEAENKRLRCTRKQNVQCSPSEGKCCQNNCKFVAARERVKCQDDDECTEASFCRGDMATCPKPSNKIDNETECNEGTKVCQSGECKGSICLKYGMDQCFLSSSEDHNKRALCDLACASRGSNKTCLSTADWAKSGKVPGLTEGMTLRPGSPCDNFQGYCDVFFKCRQVDAEGPLVRLKNLLFNQKTLLTIAQWVTTYWYAVLLMGMGFVIFMALFIKCFAAHTPSSNPRMPKNKHLSETLRRPMSTLRRKRYQQAPGSAPSSNGGSIPPPRSAGGSGQAAAGGSGQSVAGGGWGAPPPYPGAPAGGPGHGYGEGRGHYNRSRGASGGGGPERGGRSGGGGADRKSWAPNHQSNSAGNQRQSRIELKPIR